MTHSGQILTSHSRCTRMFIYIYHYSIEEYNFDICVSEARIFIENSRQFFCIVICLNIYFIISFSIIVVTCRRRRCCCMLLHSSFIYLFVVVGILFVFVCIGGRFWGKMARGSSYCLSHSLVSSF